MTQSEMQWVVDTVQAALVKERQRLAEQVQRAGYLAPDLQTFTNDLLFNLRHDPEFYE